MKATTFKMHQGEWGKSEEAEKGFLGLNNDNKRKIKTRLGFIYFVVLVCSLIVFFVR